jgi:DNA helicase-2/ATP-dependent DNA helicase PcrA
MPDFIPTPEQQAILQHAANQHARILAGPGTGKSATVVALIEGLVARNPRPKIKLLTFTRAATGELAKKVAEHPTAATTRPSTIHSFAISLLLQNPGAGGFPRPLRIADDWEQDEIIQPTLAKRVGVTKTFLKNQLLPEMASGWESLAPVKFPKVDEELRARFIGAWQEHRRVYGYTLLSELPYALNEAMRDNPTFEGVDYELLIVDEYQDLNSCDLAVLKLVADRGCVIIGTGDDDQSIYGFRWAAPEGIRRFLEDYRGAADYPLSVTQRCGSQIVRWANHIINGDPDRDRARPALRAATGAPVGEVALLAFRGERAEAQGVAAIAHGLIQTDGVARSQILVLLRGDFHRQFSKLIDRVPAGGVGARGRSCSPAGLAGYVRRPRRAA